MLHAVEAPRWKSVAIGGLAIALTTGFAFATHRHHDHHHSSVHRLALDAPVQRNAFYLTAWAGGDLLLDMDDGPLEGMKIKTKAQMDDGCNWLATETLAPIDATHFAYSYDEQILSCEPGASPYVMTPRTGIVTVY